MSCDLCNYKDHRNSGCDVLPPPLLRHPSASALRPWRPFPVRREPPDCSHAPASRVSPSLVSHAIITYRNIFKWHTNRKRNGHKLQAARKLRTRKGETRQQFTCRTRFHKSNNTVKAIVRQQERITLNGENITQGVTKVLDKYPGNALCKKKKTLQKKVSTTLALQTLNN